MLLRQSALSTARITTMTTHQSLLGKHGALFYEIWGKKGQYFLDSSQGTIIKDRTQSPHPQMIFLMLMFNVMPSWCGPY